MTASRTTTPSTRTWYVSLSALFFLHGFFAANWISRTPEIKDSLNLTTFNMGLLATVMTVGAITGTYFGVSLVTRLGARNIVRASYVLLSIAYTTLGLAVTLSDLMLSAAAVFAIGFTSSVGGLTNNLEGARLDHLSRRSVLPSLHGMFSLGLLAGSGLGALALSASLPIQLQFASTALVASVIAVCASFAIPRHGGLAVRDDMSTQEIRQIPTRAERRAVWREPRTLWIAFIGMSFVVAEGAAGTWLPIALVNSGMSQADAALGFMFFAIAMTVGRFGGGFVIDLIGRVKTTALIAAIACLGIIVVMANGLIHLPYVGAFLWGLGCSLGFPIVVSALSDEQRMATPRVNALVMTAQVSSLASGPALGGLGQIFGLFGAFALPLTLLGVGGAMSRMTAPLRSRRTTDTASTDVIDVVAAIAQREVDEL